MKNVLCFCYIYIYINSKKHVLHFNSKNFNKKYDVLVLGPSFICMYIYIYIAEM